MIEDNINTQRLPFGPEYYKDFETEKILSDEYPSNNMKITSETTNKKDEENIFNKRKDEEVDEFIEIHKSSEDKNIILYSDERISQTFQVKTNRIENFQSVDNLKEKLTLLKSRDLFEKKEKIENNELMIKILEDIIKIEQDNVKYLTSLSDCSIKLIDIANYYLQKQELSNEVEFLKKEETKKNDTSNGTNIVNNIESQKSLIEEKEITHTENENKESNQVTKKFLNKKRSSPNTENPNTENLNTENQNTENLNTENPNTEQRQGRLSKEEKEKGLKAKIPNEKRTDNKRRYIYHNCLDSINNTILDLYEKIFPNDKEKIFRAVFNNKKLERIDSIKILMKKTIENIYLESIPRYYKKEKLVENRKKTKELFENYKNTFEGKILNIISKMSFEYIFKNIYLENHPYIKSEFIEGEYKLEKFETFAQHFADWDDQKRKQLKDSVLKLNERRKRK
jgi:hypothetical protein